MILRIKPVRVGAKWIKESEYSTYFVFYHNSIPYLFSVDPSVIPAAVNILPMRSIRIEYRHSTGFGNLLHPVYDVWFSASMQMLFFTLNNENGLQSVRDKFQSLTSYISCTEELIKETADDTK